MSTRRPIVASCSALVVCAACTLVGCGVPVGGSPNAALIAQGYTLFKKHGCVTCHSTTQTPVGDSALLAPSLGGILGTTIELEDGQTRVVDMDYLRESIAEPGSDIRKGYPNQMPKPFRLSDDDLEALIAYVLTIPPAPSPNK